MKRELNFLILEDCEEDALLLQKSINNSFGTEVEFTWVGSLAECLQVLYSDSQSYTLIYCDLNLPDSRGIATIKAIKEAAPDLAIVVVSNFRNDEFAIEALREGAQDFIYKSELHRSHLQRIARHATERQSLHNELSQARRALKEQLNFKSRFLAQMSHEIRTPMNGVIGNVDVLLRSKLDAEQREIVDAIKTSGETLIHILNDILDISKIESGQLLLKHERMNIRSIVDDVIDTYSALASEKSIILTSNTSPDVPRMAITDGHRIKQILFNLVSNAVKYTDSGYVCINVSCINHPGSSWPEKLKFEVIDSGRGIADESKKILFLPYRQLAYSDQFHGTGLGLVVAKQLVNALEGQIDVESEVGKGTKFWFTIKCSFESCNISLDRTPLDGKKTILVSPNLANASIIQKQLENRGLEVVVNSSLDAFIESPTKVDLIVIEAHTWTDRDLKLFLSDATPKLGTNWLLIPNSLLLTESSIALLRTMDKNVLNVPIKQAVLYQKVARLLADGEPNVASSPEKENNNSITTTTPIANLNVLVVDDVVANLRVAERILKFLGCHTYGVTSGADALAECQNRKYDVIFMDCQMPLLSGFETTVALRGTASPNQKTPIIALTANLVSEGWDKCKEAGMNGIVGKPIRIEDIEKILPKFARTAIPSSTIQSATTCTNTLTQNSLVPHYFHEDPLDSKALNLLKSLEDPSEPGHFLNDLIDTFKEETPIIIRELKAGGGQSDRRKIEHCAHKLKGFSRNLGAQSLALVCEKIEKMSATEPIDNLTPLFTEIDRQHQVAIAALENHWKQPS